jgi:transcription elongation GreA/GreB family factor
VSVAFRRESDEEHLEPRFARPIPPGPNPVTVRGFDLIQQRVDALEAQLRDAPDEEAARDLRYWRQRLASAEPMPPATGDAVAFGSRVRFRHNGREREAVLVGHDEAAEGDGLLGIGSPLARAMIGAETGDLLPFGGRDDALEIMAVSPA